MPFLDHVAIKKNDGITNHKNSSGYFFAPPRAFMIDEFFEAWI